MVIPKQTDPQYKLRIPADLKARIEEAAQATGRSMNAEIVARLQKSFSQDTSEDFFISLITQLEMDFEEQISRLREIVDRLHAEEK